jgi:hypothetical protein
MPTDRSEAYADRREPDVKNGLRLVRLLFAKIEELDERVEALERRHGGRRRAA